MADSTALFLFHTREGTSTRFRVTSSSTLATVLHNIIKSSDFFWRFAPKTLKIFFRASRETRRRRLRRLSAPSALSSGNHFWQPIMLRFQPCRASAGNPMIHCHQSIELFCKRRYARKLSVLGFSTLARQQLTVEGGGCLYVHLLGYSCYTEY